MWTVRLRTISTFSRITDWSIHQVTTLCFTIPKTSRSTSSQVWILFKLIVYLNSHGSDRGHYLHQCLSDKEVPRHLRESNKGCVDSLWNPASESEKILAKRWPGKYRLLPIKGVRVCMFLTKEREASSVDPYRRAWLYLNPVEMGLFKDSGHDQHWLLKSSRHSFILSEFQPFRYVGSCCNGFLNLQIL